MWSTAAGNALAQANPNDTVLSGQVATLFKGETLRGLLLYAWGWSVVSTIALYAAIAALIGFVIMLFVTVGGSIYSGLKGFLAN